MKKKILSLLLAVCTLFTCALAMTGCNNNPPKTSLTKSDYVEVIDSVTTTYNSYVSSPTPQAAKTSVVIEDSDFINQDGVAQTKQMIAGTLALILFTKNILNTDSYVLKTTADDCVASYDNGHSTETYDIRFELSYDASTSTINIPVYAEYTPSYNPTSRAVNYFIFEIVYDFNTDTLSQFTICGFVGTTTNQTTSGVEFYKYKNNSVSRLDPDSPKKTPFAEEILTGMENFMSAPKEASPEDYSVQYTNAMNSTRPS